MGYRNCHNTAGWSRKTIRWSTQHGYAQFFLNLSPLVIFTYQSQVNEKFRRFASLSAQQWRHLRFTATSGCKPEVAGLHNTERNPCSGRWPASRLSTCGCKPFSFYQLLKADVRLANVPTLHPSQPHASTKAGIKDTEKIQLVTDYENRSAQTDDINERSLEYRSYYGVDYGDWFMKKVSQLATFWTACTIGH